jgi:hypothetical protein
MSINRIVKNDPEFQIFEPETLNGLAEISFKIRKPQMQSKS